MRGKKLIAMLLALCLMLTWVPVQASAAESGSCGQGLTYTLNGNTLTISGQGDMLDYDYYGDEEAPWADFREQIQRIVIEPGVTSIGSYAFYRCKALTEIIIPEGVTHIREDAFLLCESLSAVNLPSTLKSLGREAFNATGLKEVVIPEGVTEIRSRAFAECANLMLVVFDGSGEISIADDAFADSPNVTLFCESGNTAYEWALENGVNAVTER